MPLLPWMVAPKKKYISSQPSAFLYIPMRSKSDLRTELRSQTIHSNSLIHKIFTHLTCKHSISMIHGQPVPFECGRRVKDFGSPHSLYRCPGRFEEIARRVLHAL